MDELLGCRFCDADFLFPSELWTHVQRNHAREFVHATTRPANAATSAAPEEPAP